MKLILSLLVIFTILASVSQASNDGAKCDLCQILVRRAEMMVLKNETQQRIIKSMEKTCSLLPAKLSRPCVALVDFYGPLIIQKIIHHERPKLVCQQLRICGVNGQCDDNDSDFTLDELAEVLEEYYELENYESEDVVDFENDEVEFVTAENLRKWKPHIPGKNIIKKYKCKACNFLVSRAEHMVKINKTAQEIQSHLEHSCNTFGVKPAVKVCKKIVHKATHSIINELKKNTSPGHVCKAIKMC
ncbi:hypothetical protein PPL_00933 [Heterostelium album PN500]|uniref:Pulmonary surfactant-associated protein B n=1 Tax=Heterostelium pallidum (strain ATCC 26659 / Pp 5 / PN500) TaxID=670386 RepID=D3AXM7_HETP5|nr:hypothetical protein PPL_00933 [Heterostelium album PN500]EFA85704.1 hypothetical protein PPL_00933 [Heterostelium album PN500]|eukprot:XP_020437810.1 hypothetical protein PPL_00933 [Heterostelium album PN500]